MAGKKSNTGSSKGNTKKNPEPSLKKGSSASVKTVAGSVGKQNGRNDQRVPIQLLVDYRSDGSYLFDFCRDLGTGGIFIQTSEPLPQGSELDLTFTLPDSKETLSTKGQVIWVQDAVKGRNDLTAGMGVQFANFDTSQRKQLEDFVNRYHGDRFLMPRHTDPKRSA